MLQPNSNLRGSFFAGLVLVAASPWTQAIAADEMSESLVKLRPQASAGDLVAQEKLGIALAYGHGVARDTIEAARLLEPPAIAGRPAAQLALAHLYSSRSKSSADQGSAFALRIAAANNGYATAQWEVAYHYYYGMGVKTDVKEAIKWLEPAAAQGHTPALDWLAMIYELGDNVARDPERALTYALRSAELGSIDGQAHAGNLILSGQFSERYDAKVGDALLLSAANNPTAGKKRGAVRFQLALQNYLGRKRDRDGAATVKWLTAANEENYSAAKLLLAECYWKGFGVAPDAKRAEALFNEALSSTPPSELNNIAWVLSVEPADTARDGKRAVMIMEHVLTDTKQRTARHLDTFAAAYAETQQFELAVQTQTEALRLLAPSATPTFRQGYQVRLDLYKSSRSYREENRL